MNSQSVLNESPSILEGPDRLHKLIRWHEHLHSSPALDFLAADGERWKYSYAQLRAHITSLAMTLDKDSDPIVEGQDEGVELKTGRKNERRQNIIPVLLPQSPSLYISIIAVLEAGAAFCPINLDSPSDRIKFVVGDVKATAIITTRDYAALATWEGGPAVIVVDEFPSITYPLDTVLSFQPTRSPSSKDLAYIMYTSGSSGTPKGVAVSHLAATQSLLAHDPHLPRFKRFLQFAAPSFDVSVFEIFFPLFRGSTLVGCNRAKLLNDLPLVMNELEVDAAELTPTVVGSLVQNRSNVPGLRLLLTIGEMLTRPVVDEFGSTEDHDGILYGMYGPTEAAIHCTINPRMRAGNKVGNIGVPLSTVSTFICSTSDVMHAAEPTILPLGETGELVLMGSQLADGYLNRPEQHAAAFITLGGKPAYRTGDKARQLEDNTIEVLGRISAGQVKLRGQRVELGEIEEAVYKHGGIKSAVASVINGSLILFALTKVDGLHEAEILQSCQKWLPKFMIPREICLLNMFPYLPSGKVDKRRLEEDYAAKRDTEDAPSDADGINDTQRVIARALKGLLGVNVNLTTRLASVGLDSLMSIRLAILLRTEGINISPVEVVQAKTLASLSAVCDSTSSTRSPSASRMGNINFTELLSLIHTVSNGRYFPDDVEDVMPCTSIQEAMLSETAVNPLAYHNKVQLEISGDLPVETVETAIFSLARHNPILRTGFVDCQSQYSTHSQVVFKALKHTQVVKVDEFSHGIHNLQQSSLLHPFHIQLRCQKDKITLLFHLHHAIYDAWSLELMLDDLETLLSSEEPTSRPSFRKVVEDELSSTDADGRWRLEEYWRDHLAQLDPRSMPNFHSILNPDQGLDVLFLDTSIRASDLEIASRSLSVSSQSIFQAAYAFVLSSYLGTQDICFGTVFSGRTSATVGVQDIVGPCLSTLPVRLDVGTSATVGELAQHLNSINRKHLEYGTLPLKEIKKAGGIDPGRHLFDSLLVWQQTLHGYGQEREHVRLVNSADFLEFNMTLEITPTAGHIQLKANYQRSMFPIRQIELLLHQIEQHVVTIVNSPNVAVNKWSNHIRDDLLSVENPKPVERNEESLSASVELIAKSDPDRIALEIARSIDEHQVDVERLTYSQLNAQANRLANYLVICGVLPDELVCICMNKSADLYVSILATVKSDAGYLPVTPDIPQDRLLHILTEGRVKLIVTHSSLEQKLKTVPSVGLVFVDKVDFTRLSATDSPARAKQSDLAYCVFTSGSTGTPKGVLITRKNLSSNLQGLSQLYPHSKTAKFLQSCSQAFDVSVFEIFFTWYIGATLCAGTKDVLFRDLELAIKSLGITHLSLTPTVAAMVNPDNVPTVQFLVTAGEAVTRRVFNAWAGKGLWQGYGPSETTNICTVLPRVSDGHPINNIGPPLDNTSVFVLVPESGDDFTIVTRGGEGEFCFGGSQVGRGYLNKKQSEDSFFEHPEYGKLYRSGDFGRLLSDGCLSFTGRKDDQVKIHGHRVELGEVNAILLSNDAVTDCITLVLRTDDLNNTKLVSFWIGVHNTQLNFTTVDPKEKSIKNLFAKLHASLPIYMIPSALIQVSCIPSTSQGKVDKRLIERLYKSLDMTYLTKVSDSQYSPKSTSRTLTRLEQNIAKLVAKTARVEVNDVGLDTSFFGLGIDSISAISLSRALRERLDVQVEISDVLRFPSVSRLVEQVTAKSSTDSNAALPLSMNASATNPKPLKDHFGLEFMEDTTKRFLNQGRSVHHITHCTPLQEAMLSAAERSSNSGAYRNHVILSLNISEDILQTVWKVMVARHEILRTCFIKINDSRQPYAQVILDKYECEISVVAGGKSIVPKVKAEVDEEAQQAGESQPPYTLTIFKSSQVKRLLISMHHALYDGFAMTVLFEEIENLVKGKELPSPVSFVPFLKYMSNIDLSAADQYWDNLLQNFVPMPFTLSRGTHGGVYQEKQKNVDSIIEDDLDWPRDQSAQQEGKGMSNKGVNNPLQTGTKDLGVGGEAINIKLGTRTMRFVSSNNLSTTEKRLKQNRTSLLSVAQAAWAILLSKYLVQADVCFGNVVSGRTVPVEGIERLVAPCFNTVPMRVKNIHKMSHMEVFRTLHLQNINVLPFQLTPLRRIQSRLGSGPLFDTLVILQPPATSLDRSIWSMEDDSGAMDVPVVIEIVPRPQSNTLELILHIHTSILATYDPAEMLEEYDSIFQRSLANPRHPVLSAFARASVEKNAAAQMGARSKSERASLEGRSNGSEAMNARELEIRDVFANFTDIPKDKITKSTSIYRLGLDSISAVQVATALRKISHHVMASDILNNPSIEKLALHISNTGNFKKEMIDNKVAKYDFTEFDRQYRDDISKQLGVTTNSIKAIRPCTSVQNGMLAQTFHSAETDNDELDYVNSFCMELDNGVDVARIKQAWQRTMADVEILRTGFIGTDSLKLKNGAGERTSFVMVTYEQSAISLELPWTENDEDSSATILERLSISPWSLHYTRERGATLIKFKAHHALYDAQSLDIILSEVASHYEKVTESSKFINNIEPLLGALLSTENEHSPQREEFWKRDENKISTVRFPDLTPLRQSGTRSIVHCISSTRSLRELELLCRERDVSLQSAGHAAWGRLLASYTGESSVTFGTTLSGRSIYANADGIAFPTIVTLPVSCSVTGTNTELLNRMMQTNAQLHKHQFTPLRAVQKWAGNGSGGKMFDTLFAYQKPTLRDSEKYIKGPWKIVKEEAAVDYLVSLELQPIEPGSLIFRLTAREDLVPAEQAELLLKQFDILLLDLLYHGDHLCISAPVEIPNLLSISPAAEAFLPSPVQLLHDFVATQAKKSPRKIALEFTTTLEPRKKDTRSWTYEQLEKEGNKIANFLLHRRKSAGNGGCLVGICFEKCPEASFAILGIMKAGFAYVALDPNAPPDRMGFIMEDSKSTILLTAGKPADRLIDIFSKMDDGIDVIRLDALGLLDRVSSDHPKLPRQILPEDTCYCLYTSGTTGTPKGCEITHFNAVQAMLAFQRLFADHWTPESKWLQFASFHFDVSVLEQFWSWSVGICVASAPRDLIFEDIPAAIRGLGITHIDLTPSLARLVHPDEVPGLTKGVFITGGEQLRQEILDIWGEKGCIYNGYGPTEVTIGCTMYPRVPSTGKPPNIGPQFQNVGSYVLRPGTSEPVLRGGVGELCVSGALVGKGYLNRPELTQERFPVLENFNERIYRTGDLVRILYNGDFLFLGRADDQVKLRGQRLELTEINEVMKKNVDNLHEIATLVLKHPLQQKEQLVSFFVPSPKAASTQNMIGFMRRACEAYLPGYMVPTHFIVIEKLPLSANNKADAKQLANTFNEISLETLRRMSATGSATTPWSENELKAVEGIADYLGIEVLAVKNAENIFELGIDSISVIGLSRQLQKSGYINAKLSTIMQNSSISALVKMLTSTVTSGVTTHISDLAAVQDIASFAEKHMSAAARELNISSSAIDAIAPSTATQEGIIYEFLGSLQPLYFNRFEFRLATSVDEAMLESSWRKVQEKLQVLRTKFVLTTDGVAQVVIKPEQSGLTWRVASVSNRELEEELGNDIKKIGTLEKSIALQRLWCVSIVKSENEERIMVLSIFHAIYDGIALPLLLNSLAAEYAGWTNFDYGPEFHSILPYGPLRSVDSAKAEEFFRTSLKQWEFRPVLQDITQENSANVDVSVSRILPKLEHLPRLRQILGVTDQAILQAAWVSVLQHLLESTNVTFGVVVSGRSIDFPNAERVIGPLLNTIPYNVSVVDTTWGGLIKKCHEKNVAVLPWQNIGLRKIQRWVSGGAALFESLFVFQREGEQTSSEFWKEINGKAVADYPLAFEAQLSNNGQVTLIVVAKKHILSTDAAQKLLESVEVALQNLQKLDDLVPVNRMDKNGKEKVSEEHLPKPQLKVNSADSNFEWTPAAITIKFEIEQLIEDFEAPNINKDTSIFELGLDSIDVIKLSSRLKQKDINLPVSVIVSKQTIAKMVPWMTPRDLEHCRSTTYKTLAEHEDLLLNYMHRKAMIVDDIKSVLPATPSQEGMIAAMFSSEYEQYFNSLLYRVHEETDMTRLKQAWEVVISMNDILRTKFVPIEDSSIPVSFAQVVYRGPEVLWKMVKMKSEKVLKSELSKLYKQERMVARSQRNFLQFVEIWDGTEKYLLVSISHALYDGISLKAIHGDVSKAYRGVTFTRPDPYKYIEVSVNSDTPEANQFWRNALTGVQPAKFPRLLHNKGYPLTSHSHLIEGASYMSLEAIRSFCRQQGITLATLGQTAWALVLASRLQKLDVVFGTVLSCRDTNESLEVMFPLMNTVAVRTQLKGSVVTLLRDMQARNNEMATYQHFPLRKAQVLAGVYGTLFDTLFIYQTRNTSEMPLLESERIFVPFDNEALVHFAVCVEMEIVSGELMLRASCQDDVLDDNQTQKLLDQLQYAIQWMITFPGNEVVATTPDFVSIAGMGLFRRQFESVVTGAQGNDAMDIDDASRDWTVMERMIGHAISEVSQVPESDIHRNQTIFHVGLDSISAIKLSSILRRQGIRLAVKDMTEKNSIEKLAQLATEGIESVEIRSHDVATILQQQLEDVDLNSIMHKVEADSKHIKQVLPVTAGQVYMLNRWKLSRGRQFVGSFKFRLKEDYDEVALHNAWQTLLKRHAILRTTFVESNSVQNQYMQVVPYYVETPYHQSGRPKSAAESMASPHLPVVMSVSNSSDAAILELEIHHALYDGVSLPLLLHDLDEIYANNGIGDIMGSAVGFREFITLGQDPESISRRMIFWKHYLGMPQNWIPPVMAGAIIPERKRLEVFQPNCHANNLVTISRNAGVSIDALLLAVFSQVYFKHLNPFFSNTLNETLFGIYLANRNPQGEDLSALAAPTLNLLPIRAHLDMNMSDRATKIQSDLREINSDANAMTSLREIYEWTGARVNWFVNIVKDKVTDAPPGHLFAGGPEENSGRRKRAIIVDLGLDNGDIEIAQNGQEAYCLSVDIELRITDDGKCVDIGLFSPEELLDLTKAENFVDELKIALRDLK